MKTDGSAGAIEGQQGPLVGGVGDGAPLDSEGVAAEAATEEAAVVRGLVLEGRLQALASVATGEPVANVSATQGIAEPATLQEPAIAGEQDAEPAPIRGGDPTGRMSVLEQLHTNGAAAAEGVAQVAKAPEQGCIKVGTFESSGAKMWGALGARDDVVDLAAAKEILPPHIFSCLERMSAGGETPTVADLEKAWLNEAAAVEIRGAGLDDLVAYAEMTAAGEVAGLLGADPDAVIDAAAQAELTPAMAATYELLAASGQPVTVGDLAKARAADAAVGIREGAGEHGLSKKETRRLPADLKAIVRTYLLEGRSKFAVQRDAGDVAEAVAGSAGAGAGERVKEAAGEDGVLSKRERKQLEASERQAVLSTWLEGAGEGAGSDELVAFLSQSASDTVSQALGEQGDAVIDDGVARKALPSHIYGRLRALSGSEGKPVTVGQLRAAVVAAAESDARAAMADGNLSTKDQRGVARWMNPTPVQALRQHEHEVLRAGRDTAVDAWRDDIGTSWPSSLADFWLALQPSPEQVEIERRQALARRIEADEIKLRVLEDLVKERDLEERKL